MPDVLALVGDFVLKLRRRKVEGSHAVARHTAELLRSVVSQQRVGGDNQAAALADAVRAVGKKLIDANPVELAGGNIVRRVLHIIRVEDEDIGNSDDEFHNGNDNRLTMSAVTLAARAIRALRAPSLQTLLENIPVTATEDSDKSKFADKNSKGKKLKHDVIAAIGELIQEMDTCYDQIAEQAVELIHQNEVILTLGSYRTAKEFLLAAKDKKRSFMYMLLKVIVGAHAIMANGGVIAPVGTNMVALAAQWHDVTFVVVAGSHKVVFHCPLYPHNPEVLLNELELPSDLLDLGEFSNCMDFITRVGTPLLNVVNPAFDYVPPNLIRLFTIDPMSWARARPSSGAQAGTPANVPVVL